MLKLFPIHLYKGTIKPAKNQEDKSIKKLEELFSNCSINSWPGESYKSTGELGMGLHLLEEFEWLIKPLSLYVEDYWNNGLQYAPLNIQLRDSWANLHLRGDTTIEHSHSDGYYGNCHVSAVYYLRKPTDCGHIRFCDPLDYIKRLTPYRSLQGNDLLSSEVKAEQYDFILFPSWIRHKVCPHPSEEKRIALSFNYIGL